jgi:predicted Ser/Thr protein kinase
VEATLDNRMIKDPMTGEERKPDERFLRSVEEKIDVSDSGQAILPSGDREEGDGRVQARR